MPTDLHIVRTSEFVRLDANGKFNLERTSAALVDIANACRSKGVHHALIDVRGATAQFTTTDVYKLAKEFAESGFKPTDCLAIVHPFSGNLADIFAGFAEEHGMRVRAFANYEEAVEWFSTELPA